MKVALPSSPFNRADLFEAAGFEVVEGRVRSTEDFIELMKDADGAQVGVMPLTTREVMEACPKLKVVSRLGVGVDSIDLDAATELGVLACNVPGVNTTEVADHAVAMLLSITRCLHDAIASTRQGQWRENPRTTGNYVNSVRRIAGHVVGIVGFGNIGRAFATRIRGFGPAEIIAYDPYVEQTVGDLYGVRMVDFEEILQRCDYISIHCSATAETRHLFNSNTLGKLKPTAVLVNTARGPIIDGGALAAALESGQLGAAALDVTEIEPVESHDPLLKLPNCIVTPHIAGFSPVFLEECPIRQAENIIRVLTGEKPHGLANPEVIKTIAVMHETNTGRWAGVPGFSTAMAV